MRSIAAITDPSVARLILECLARSSRAPPFALARDLDLGSVIGRSEREPALTQADGDPDFDFNQSPFEDQISDDAS